MAFPPSARTSSMTRVTAGWELLTMAFLERATSFLPWLGRTMILETTISDSI